MRTDNIGFFWQDASNGVMVKPPIKDIGWIRPKDFPNLKGIKRISFDTETYDPNLNTSGAGWATGVGNLLGVSIATEDSAWYFPIAHKEQSNLNFDKEQAVRFFKDVFEDASIDKIGANITYDIGWLLTEGIKVNGKIDDIIMAESVLYPGYPNGLDDIAQRRGIGKKDTNELYDWLRLYTGSKEKDLRKYIYLAPASYVGKYAETDAILPLNIYDLQQKEFNSDDKLAQVYDLEKRLIPLLIKMRLKGTCVDYEEAQNLKIKLSNEITQIENNVYKEVGFVPNVNASRSMADLFDKLHLPYSFTEKGNPSFKKEFLKSIEHPIIKGLLKVKEYKKLISTFIDGYIFNSSVNGKIYTTFNQLKVDENGAITGRFSSSKPNLQNIPSKGELGSMVRNIFIPNEKGWKWRKYDYSQVEYRCFAHFAVGEGSNHLREEYAKDPKTDYHNKTHDLVLDKTGMDLARKIIKTVNFGILYGLGKEALAFDLGISLDEAVDILNTYHSTLPFVKTTMKFYSDYANKNGEIRTYLGRRTFFDEWEMNKFGQYQRKGLYRSLNYLLQGSAADIMKISMVNCYEEGLFDEVGYPMITVHDELDFSDSGYTDDGFDKIKNMMENSARLKVPLIADCEIGTRWGNVEEV